VARSLFRFLDLFDRMRTSEEIIIFKWGWDSPHFSPGRCFMPIWMINDGIRRILGRSRGQIGSSAVCERSHEEQSGLECIGFADWDSTVANGWGAV
jgi:hypothetical protein